MSRRRPGDRDTPGAFILWGPVTCGRGTESRPRRSLEALQLEDPVVLPHTLVHVDAVPAKLLMVPSGLTLRTRWAMRSTM